MPWLLSMTLIVSVLLIIAHLYIGWRFTAAARRHHLNKAVPILWLFLLSFYAYPFWGLMHYLFGGTVDMLTLWAPGNYWFWFGFVAAVHFSGWLLVADILYGLSRLSSVSKKTIQRIYDPVIVTIAVGLFIFTGITMQRHTTQIQTRHHTVDAPHAYQGFRIAHITDLQGDEFTGRPQIRAYINKVNALNPDVVIFTGDLISYGTDFIAMAAQELAKVQAPGGVIAVIGDHDYWAGVPNFEQAYKRNGIQLLQDENSMIPAGNDSLLLTGITEVYSKHIAPDALRKLTTSAEANFKVLATHQATDKVIAQARAANYNLLLGGHTHGGQLRVPFLGMTFSAAERDTDYLSGAFRFGSMLLNVDNGLGFTLAPVRYNAPPTISVINFE